MYENIMTMEELKKLEDILRQDEIYRKDLADTEDLLKRLLELLPSESQHRLNLLVQDFDAVHYSLAQRKAELAFQMGKNLK